MRDADGRESTGTVSVDVLAPEDFAPRFLARDDDALTRAGQAVVVAVLTNDEGAPPLTVDTTKTSDPPNGTASCTAAGSCTYTPDAGFHGHDAFTYTVEDGEDAVRTAAVRITVAPPSAAHAPLASGTPDAGAAVRQGETASWAAAVGATPDGIDGGALKALAAPQLTVTLTGAHALEPGTLKTAPGWNAAGTGPVTVTAGAGALLGEAVSTPLARPLPPISQGTGGDGHVPILVGSKVFAVFHHQTPTQITCADRLTGQLCPGYPQSINVASSDINGPAAVVGTKLYMHLSPTTATAQTAAVTLYCWDTATDRTCGLETLGRVKTSGIADASAPVLVGGKIYLGAFDDKLYCFDPATQAPCAKPTLPLGLGILPVAGTYGFDILANGSRVYVSQRQGGKVSCIDVSSGERCAGWTEARTFDGAWNLVRRHAADGAVNGMCVVSGATARCWADATPGVVVELSGWPATEGYYSVTQEAEAGTRTLLASHGMPGAACWDWTTLAPCTGGAYVDGYIQRDIDGANLPSGYGIAWDGACAIGLGDPGLIYTVDPAGSAPCTSLGSGTDPLSVDLRDQRADGTVGAAVWKEVALLDTPPSGTELTSFVVTIRDRTSGQQLVRQDLIGGTGKLDLSGIDPLAHPALTLEATSVSKAGDPAWADGLPPRVRLLWQGDPQQVAFKTRAAVACDGVAPIGLSVASAGVAQPVTTQLPTLRSLTCNDPPAIELGAARTVNEETPLTIDPTSSDPQGTAPAFTLVESPPGAVADATTGRITWTPTEAQGPGAFTLRLRATDTGTPAKSAEDVVTVNVAEVNRPPAIEPLGTRAVKLGEAVTATARASDPDLPANALAFSVVSPVGPKVDARTGAISWTPALPGSFPVTVRVTDNGAPPLSADAVLATTVEAPPKPPATPAPVTELLLGCAKRDLVLEDVVVRGTKVEFVGFTDARFAGRAVEIVYEATGKTVASPVVAADGSFSALAPLPPKKQRAKARYLARIGDERSLNLKLQRRMVITGVRPQSGTVTFTGRVIPPLAQKKADRSIEIRRRVSCGKDEVVGRAKPAAGGAFRITVAAPTGVEAAVYRFRTKIRANARSRRPTNTFTLPRVVLFTGS